MGGLKGSSGILLDTRLTQRRGTRNLSSSFLFFDGDSSQYYIYTTQFFFPTGIAEITPYFIVCCKHVYDCNSTKARWSQPEIRTVFAQIH